MMQTPTHVSLLQRLLQYFELAATVASVIPEPHVRAIGGLVGIISSQLEQSPLVQDHVQAVNEGLLPMGLMVTQIPNPIVSGGVPVEQPIEKPMSTQSVGISLVQQFMKNLGAG